MRTKGFALATLGVAVIACSGNASSTSTLVTTSTITDITSTSEATTTTSTTTTSTTTPTTTTLPGLPPEFFGQTHGGDAWAVVLMVSDVIDDPAFDEATEAARAVGYHPSSTDCDFGAATVFGKTDEEETHYYSVSLYFQNEEDATAALEGLRARGIDGAVGVVQTYCMD